MNGRKNVTNKKEKFHLDREKRKPDRMRITFLSMQDLFTWMTLLLAASVCFLCCFIQIWIPMCVCGGYIHIFFFFSLAMLILLLFFCYSIFSSSIIRISLVFFLFLDKLLNPTPVHNVNR